MRSSGQPNATALWRRAYWRLVLSVGIALEMSRLHFLMHVLIHDTLSWQPCSSIPARIRTTSVRAP
jgi:hypothetical protein